MSKYFLRSVFFLWLAFVLAGCSEREPQASSASMCTKDIDCKGDRICEKGVCMSPGVTSPLPPMVGKAGIGEGRLNEFRLPSPNQQFVYSDCMPDECQWGRILSTRVVERSLNEAVVELRFQVGESKLPESETHDGQHTQNAEDATWQDDIHAMNVRCSHSRPQLFEKGFQLDILTLPPTDAYNLDLSMYFTVCHADSEFGSDSFEKYGYRQQEKTESK